MSTAVEKRPASELEAAERKHDRPWFHPSVNIHETEEELVLTANMPGVESDQIDVQFENGVLTIHGRVPERQRDGTRYLLREYSVGDYHRSFEVSETIDAQRISARYLNGVLTLHLPKVERAKPRRITVAVK